MLGLWLFYAFAALATLTLLLPLWQVPGRWKDLSEAQRIFAVYLGLEFLIELACFVLGRLGRRNLWVAHLGIPVETALIVLAFSAWQVDQRMRVALRLGAPLMFGFWLPPLLGWEPMNDFSIGIDSIQAILCLALAAYTVVRRSFDYNGPGLDQAWFWIGSGVMLYFATFALMNPLNSYFIKHSPATAFAVLTVRGGFQVFANVLYYRGMRCPPSRQSFGPSSSSPRPWLPFSWSRSGRP